MANRRNLLAYELRVARSDDPKYDPDYQGIHCSPRDLTGGKWRGYIDADYGADFFSEIADAMSFSLQDKFREDVGDWYEMPGEYDDEYDEWIENAVDFFRENGIRWVFVSGKHELREFGDNCYYVILKDNAILAHLDDIRVRDMAYAVVYDEGKGKPEFIPTREEE